MGIIRRMKNVLRAQSAKLAVLMGLCVLATSCWFARGDFWETLGTDVSADNSNLIIIDAGHGGNDPGKIGVDGVLEKDLNLAIALKLKSILEQQDMVVMLTREGDEGLYDENASNKKAQDMQRRVALINEENPACVISIHQNSYHEESICGAQVFFYETSGESASLASMIQDKLISFVDPENTRQAKANDTYYLLKKTTPPTVIVECGFLSNYAECAKLQENTYQDELAWAVSMGVMMYLNQR